MSSWYTSTTVHAQLVHHVYCPCPVKIVEHTISLVHVLSTPSLLTKPSPYTISPAHEQSEYHLYCPCTITGSIIPPFRHMGSQNTISTTRVQSVYNLFCPCSVKYHLSYLCPVSTPSLLPMSSQYTLSCPNPFSTSSLLTMSSPISTFTAPKSSACDDCATLPQPLNF